MLQAILIAVVIEFTEVMLFGLAGFFAPPSSRGAAPVDAAPRSSRPDGRPRAGRESPQATAPGAAAPKATATAASDGHDETRWRTTSRSRPRDEPSASGCINEEWRRAVDAFAASLRRGADLRATGSELFDAYSAMCVQRGWPPMPRNVFGQLLRPAVDATLEHRSGLNALVEGTPAVKLIVAALARVLVVGGPTYAQEDAANVGAVVFRKCMACHQVGPDARNSVGPILNGTIGRPAGTHPGYNYSPATRNSGLVWDEQTLTRYLRAPRELVPGTRMAFAGLKDDRDIADVIAYLKQFDEEGRTIHQ